MTGTHLLFISLALSLGAAVEVQRPRGVPITKRQFYDENLPFTCLDGSRTIPFDRVNDDYCDCKDGSDEPGTSACPNGNFHCTNAGFRPTFIPSSRINDGICDCCDTTDEYNSGAKCENTCKELGRKEREVLQRMAEITKEGFLLKQQLIEEAKAGQQERQRKLTEMQNSRKEMEEKVEALRTVKETAEVPEKEAKERHLKAWEGKADGVFVQFMMMFVFFSVSLAELQTHAELDSDADGSFSETEAQALFGGAEQVDTAAFERVWSNIKDKYVSEVTSCSALQYNVLVTLSVWCLSVMPSEVAVTVLSSTAAQKARDDFEESERALREVEDQIKNIEKEISFDFGPSAEYTYLYSQCYELPTSEYIYRLCPFNRVSQKPKYGGSETNLGTWGAWAGPEENKYLLMKYEHGTGCWQGPNRSTTVKLTCGKETAVTSTSEPSRCEYLMEFTTPAVCQDPPNADSSLPGHDEF
uniref:Glucosidase 2 subunit beta n=1 Tax=Electrophorus electricus TaxID=8005 RepID=A0A4W4EET1_ELEEL